MIHARIAGALVALIVAAVAPPAASASAALRVVAVESFIADMARQVGGDRIRVDELIPAGVDPHAYEPAPRDIALVSESDLVVANGAGLETFLPRLLEGARGRGPGPRLLEASAGIPPRAPRGGEPSPEPGSIDPHFWLDPLAAIGYVENIRDALGELDSPGADAYRSNASAYVAQLRELDRWIAAEVARIPVARRKLVTNHDALGYFADRYGFTIIGTIVPSMSSEASSGARDLARLVNDLRKAEVASVFLETGADPRLVREVAAEAGVRTVTELYTDSLTPPGGPAASYLQMMRANTLAIVGALAPTGMQGIDELGGQAVEGRILGPLSYPFMQRGMLAAVLVGILCAVVGCFVVLRSMAFLGDAMAHAILPGVAVAYLLRGELLLGALGAALVVALGIGGISRRGAIREDSAIGILFAAALSLGIMLISSIRTYAVDLSHILFGNVLGVGVRDLAITGGIGIAVLIVILLLYKELVVISFDPLLAATLRLPAERLRVLLYVLLALAIVASMQSVGVGLVSAMLVTPAATAQLLARRLSRMMVAAAVIGALSAVIGLFVSYWFNVASGASIVLTATAFFLLALAFAPRRGVVWRSLLKATGALR